MPTQDIYKRRQTWKILLALLGLIIVLITMAYSMYLADQLAENEEKNVRLYIRAQHSIHDNPDPNADFDLELALVQELNTIPVILEDESGLLVGNNYSEAKNEDQDFLAHRKQVFIDSGKKPLEGFGYSKYVYYDTSTLYRLITYFPLVQVLLLSAFVGLGYFLFSSSRKAEQNRVWAGMAKETAHQLGTPISAIIAWIDYLKELSSGNVEQMEILDELTDDVDRLVLIADRFSKIGSNPKLETYNIFELIDKTKTYMQRRASKRVEFDFPDTSETLNVNVNQHLFEWVTENLIRNSLDAMDAVGKLTGSIYEDNNMVTIDITDTGKGIPLNKYKTVFEPGFTTKSRGWGLGLSLAKRIIENYHKGKIFVKSSKINEGTTFTIKLPKA